MLGAAVERGGRAALISHERAKHAGKLGASLGEGITLESDKDLRRALWRLVRGTLQ
jgi:hypothetical protein